MPFFAEGCFHFSYINFGYDCFYIEQMKAITSSRLSTGGISTLRAQCDMDVLQVPSDAGGLKTLKVGQRKGLKP